MSDIFQEVDEEVRREQLKKLWDRYGHFVIAAAILFILAVGAWRGYQWYQAKQAAAASARYDTALELAEKGQTAEAATALAAVSRDATTGYRVLARLREAAVLAESDTKAAVAAYDALAADSSLGRPLQDLAIVRAGLILVDTESLSELTRRLEPAATADGAFRHTARELLALGAFRTGDMATVRRWTEAIVADMETPGNVRQRAELLATLAGDGGKS